MIIGVGRRAVGVGRLTKLSPAGEQLLELVYATLVFAFNLKVVLRAILEHILPFM
jgi:hypothetical protein